MAQGVGNEAVGGRLATAAHRRNGPRDCYQSALSFRPRHKRLGSSAASESWEYVGCTRRPVPVQRATRSKGGQNNVLPLFRSCWSRDKLASVSRAHAIMHSRQPLVDSLSLRIVSCSRGLSRTGGCSAEAASKLTNTLPAEKQVKAGQAQGARHGVQVFLPSPTAAHVSSHGV